MSDLSNRNPEFHEIIRIIENARSRAYSAVNSELINMYWEIGAHICNKVN